MIEDALDKFLVDMGGGRPKGVLGRVGHMPMALAARHKVSTQIDKIKVRMHEIKDNVTTFGLMSLGSSGRASSFRQPVRPVVVPEIDKTQVIGFKDDIDNICAQLIDHNVSRRSVISIVGPGGRGKTTVATKVYTSAGVERHFDSRIWLTVSQEFKIIDILKKMLDKLREINENIYLMDEEFFITELHKSLSKKKYLIVLDDVWSSDLWTQLEVALPEDHNGSRVLITTRFFNVAEESDTMSQPYELRILNEDESQQLLLTKVFPNQFVTNCPDNLLPLTNLFAQKCGGWPLALVVLGGILSTKDPDYNTWNEIMLKMDWHIEGSKCLDIISTSYKDLPSHLKPCFIYIASFPEDYKIKATTLFQLWIVEGFIQHDPTKTMEEIAENYLEELVQRCMVQVSNRLWSGKIKYCYMHDILRELAIRKAKEDNFLMVCCESNVNSISGTTASTRRVAFHEFGNTELTIGSVGPSIRTLIYFGEQLPNYNELRMVRVMHIEYGWALRYHEDDSQWLKHLTTLRYFQSNGKFKLSKMPTSFWNNNMLRYVKIEGSFVIGPLSSVNLENLLTLKGVVARDEWSVKLPHFPRIRKLGISITPDFDWEAMTSSMIKLEHLNSLSLFTQWGKPLTSPCLTPAFKNYKQMQSLHLCCRWPGNVIGGSRLFPPHLVKLSLERSCLMQDPMPELEKLPCLRVLHLLTHSYVGKWLVCSTGGFGCLQQLKLDGLQKLVELEVEEGAMPMLNLLEIWDCPELQIFPNLQHLPNLRELMVRYMSDQLFSRLEGADRHKVQHIPSIKRQ
ncbi:Disease resistance protein (CC-NBS-LRR class) family [Rhynchospora pubera]|uniref:Disease resistance protein (CC-NBS-LRR class) family n=1 Tax=Rhynchospora pubera TaxID=906938 RepID=A0AAV8C0U9_9POAL|nr:Disease resistance protein (CC-NBS-LRR class) family [Rhynchospora pubera]